MILSRVYFQVFIILAILHQIISIHNPINFVFSSLPIKTIDLIGDEGIATNFKIASQANLIFVSLGGRGCMVVDGKEYDSIYEYKSDDFLSAVGVTSDAKHVLFSHKNQLAIFEFVNRKEFVFIASASFYNLVILDIIVSHDDKYAIAVGEQGKLIVYNIAIPSQIYIACELTTQATLINRVNLSKDNKLLFVGDNELGFTLIKVEFPPEDNTQQKQKVTLNVVGNGQAYWKIFECIPTKDLEYVYCTDYWYGIYIATLKDILQRPESDYPISIQFKERQWPLDYLNPLVFSLQLLNDDKYLLVTVRSLGIFIFDIANREELIFYQKIEVEGQPVQLDISPFDGNIIYTNKIQLSVFKQIPPNLNNQQPNLFNGHQSMIVEYYPDVFYKWRCYVSNDDEYLYSTQDYMGLVIAQIPNKNPYELKFKQLIPAVPPNFTEAATVTKNRKYIFYAVQEDKCTLKVYDISNVDDIKVVDCLEIEQPTQHAEEQAISDDEKILVLSYDNGILIVDISNPEKTALLSYWQMGELMIGNLAGVMITKDKKWVLGTVRGYGVCALSIIDPRNPIFTDSINTHGGEAVKASPYKDQIAYLIDGYRGVAVIDLTALPDLKIIGRVQLKGWSNDLAIFTDDKYLLVSTMDDGQLTLVNSSNPFNLYVVSMFKEGTESAQSSCFTSDFKYAFINNEYGTRIMPLYSQIIIHTQITQFEINIKTGTYTQSSLSKNDILQVGQNIQLDFIPIYQINGMVILDILYYSQSNLQILALPRWMSLINSNQSLTFQVPKESLGSDVSTPVENTILLKSALKLSPDSFIYEEDNVKIDQAMATKIFNIVKDKLLFLDDRSFVTTRFRFNSIIKLDDLQLNDANIQSFIEQKVKLILQQAVFYNPVVFRTQSSLFFSKLNDKEMISTPSKNIKINIQFLNNTSSECIFVNIAYSGCIQELSSDQNTIQLTGSLQNINNVLSNQIIYHCKEQFKTTDQYIQLSIIDNLNYDYIEQIKVTEALFLKFLDPIKKSPQSVPLQKQFESQYAKSQIAIETDVNFSFDNNYFVQPQESFLPITYSLFYYSSDTDDYVEATSGYWIKLEKDQLKFFGLAKASQLSTTEKLKIVASNGYQQTFEVFQIYIELVSFIYVLNIFLRVFGFMLGLFGLYKFKSQITNFILNDKVLFSDEFAVINQPFFKQITIMGDDFEIAQLLFNKYKNEFMNGKVQITSRVPKVTFQKQILQIPSSNQSQMKDEGDLQQFSNNNNNINNNQLTIHYNNFHNGTDNQSNLNQLTLKANSNYTNSIEPDLHSRRIKSIEEEKGNNSIIPFEDSQIQNKQTFYSTPQTKYDKRVQESQKRAMSYSSNLLSLIVGDQKNQKYLKKRAKNVSSLLLNQNHIKKTTTSFSKFNNSDLQKDKLFQTRYIGQDGMLQIDLLINDMSSNKISTIYQKRKYTMESLKPILINQGSVFFNCLKAVACRYFLETDPKTLHLYKYLKEYALLTSSYSHNDWYKYYFDITYYSSNSNCSIEDLNKLDEEEEINYQGARPKLFTVNSKHQKDKEMEDFDVFKNPLPLCKLREKVLNEILFNLGIIHDKTKGIDSIIDSGINPNLIRSVLLADALGFYKTSSLFFLPSLGESIHIYPHTIKQIQASYLVPNQSCFSNNKESESYEPFSLQMQLPQWLSAKIVRNSLIFSGIPRYSDEKVLFIKIMNNSNLIIRKFRICLLEEFNQSFSRLAKYNKVDKIQPVYANYFHDRQSSLKEQELEIQDEENTSQFQQEKEEEKKIGGIEDNYSFKNNFKQLKLNFTLQSNQLINIQEEKEHHQLNELENKKGFAQSFKLPIIIDQSEQNVIERQSSLQSKEDKQIEEKQETMHMLELLSNEITSVNQTIVPIFSFQPQFNKQKSTNQSNAEYSNSFYQSSSALRGVQDNISEQISKIEDKSISQVQQQQNVSFI